jgi:hypothetical protein
MSQNKESGTGLYCMSEKLFTHKPCPGDRIPFHCGEEIIHKDGVSYCPGCFSVYHLPENAWQVVRDRELGREK